MATVYTIGHSTRTAEELIALLQRNAVRTVVDVRRYPGSRRHPQFGKEALAGTLNAASIGYIHAPDLGGRRAAAPDSPNRAWRNAAFRGYADYMATAGFDAALRTLEQEVGRARTAILCAEAVPWRCHRNLIADALLARGHEVIHVLDRDSVRMHVLSPHARVQEDGRIVYPGGENEQLGLRG
jgi:uncharacterized protein (DUF488 family)